MNEEISKLSIYAIRDPQTKKWYRGYRNCGGSHWVDKLDSARLYVKLSQARSRRTSFATDAKPIVTELIEFVVTQTQALDDSIALERGKQEKSRKEQERITAAHQRKLDEVQYLENRLKTEKAALESWGNIKR